MSMNFEKLIKYIFNIYRRLFVWLTCIVRGSHRLWRHPTLERNSRARRTHGRLMSLYCCQSQATLSSIIWG